jgi:hypothetical protein
LQQIYLSELQEESEDVKKEATMRRAKRMMERARQKAIPTNPPSVQALIATFENSLNLPIYQDLYVGHVYHDFFSRRSPGQRSRKYALIFKNPPVLPDVYRTCTFFSMDGTFKTTPRLGNDFSDRASQILLITADYHGKIAVLFVVIMQCRKRALYKKVFRAIKEKEPDFEPAQMMSDYERSMRRSFQEIYPDARSFGCR